MKLLDRKARQIVHASSSQPVPLHRVFRTGKELWYIRQAVESGHSAGNGRFSQLCQALLETELRVPGALLTTSCTAALEMAALLLDLRPGDEVILPSFTFTSTANAFVLRGARPIFADIRPDTLNLDERQLPSLITPRTRAIVPVHYAGIACAMDDILDLSSRHGIAVVEDAAHGLFGSYRNRPLGSLGLLATLSFHETKNFTCGEGGALLINDPKYRHRAQVLWNKGTNRADFAAGLVDRYSWVDIGSSFLASEVCAAFLFAQLRVRRQIQAARRGLWDKYAGSLQSWAAAQHVQLPQVPTDCVPAYHLFYLVLPDGNSRCALLAHLKDRGIGAAFHYQPLHTSPMGTKLGGRGGECPVAESISERLVRLPFYTGLSPADQQRTIDAVLAFRV